MVANLLAAEAPSAIADYFNVACGDRISLLALVEKLNTILGTDLVPQHGPPRSGDVRDSQADIEKIRQLVGFASVVSFDVGLMQTVDYFRKVTVSTYA